MITLIFRKKIGGDRLMTNTVHCVNRTMKFLPMVPTLSLVAPARNGSQSPDECLDQPPAPIRVDSNHPIYNSNCLFLVDVKALVEKMKHNK